VALQAKIGVLGGAVGRLQQLVLEIGDMRIVALQAVAHRRAVDVAFRLAGVLIGVAPEAQLDGCDGGQLDARNVFAYTQFVAAQTSRGDGRVHRFPLVLSSWQVMHLAASVLGSSGTGCVFA
jgi:hypothetical protein